MQPLTIPHFLFLEKKEAKKQATRSLWTNPLDCPFQERGARPAGGYARRAAALAACPVRRAPVSVPETGGGDLSALAIVAAVTGGQGLFFRAACAACVVHTAAQPLRPLAVQAPLLGQPITLPPSPTRMGHGAGG